MDFATFQENVIRLLFMMTISRNHFRPSDEGVHIVDVLFSLPHIYLITKYTYLHRFVIQSRINLLLILRMFYKY